MVVVVEEVYYITDNMKRRIYKTAREPTRYYYLKDNIQMMIPPEDIPDEVKKTIPVRYSIGNKNK